MNKTLKYLLLALLIAFAGSRSVYFSRLSTLQANEKQGGFDATLFAQELWKSKLPRKITEAVDLSVFSKALTTDTAKTLDRYTHAMAIGNYRYCLVAASGIVTGITEDEVMIQVTQDHSFLNARIATEFIYGNAIRDASGLLQIQDFSNTTDLNKLSEALNGIVRATVVPSFKQQVKKGSRVSVVGAVELNKEHLVLTNLEIIPVSVKIIS